jgi:IMP dehydrogenase
MAILKSEALSFDDVLLVPQYSEIDSRSEIKVQQNLRNVGDFSLPIISSPMDTVTGGHMAYTMSCLGGLGIIHRYNTVDEQVKEARLVKMDGWLGGDKKHIGAAIGVGGDFLDRALALREAGVSFLCIDVAHGHHAKVRYALEALRNTLGTDFHIMAGNVATLEGFNDLADWGADSIRVGIGGGSICSTRIQTGHGVPTLQSIIDCSASDRDATLIADGGIKNSGDIVKALAAGADFVMLGSLLAGTEETPGSIIRVDGELRKRYRGMASKDAQYDWKGSYRSVEGIAHSVPLRGPVHIAIEELEVGIRSGLSYSGALNVPELHRRSSFVRQTSAGQVESSAHIVSRY